MYLKKTAQPIAPATSGGGVSVYQALDRDERASGAAALPPLASGEAALSRTEKVRSQVDHEEARNDIPASNDKRYAYLISYARLRELLGYGGGDHQSVVLSPDRLENAVKMLLRAVQVDEDWYLRQHPDVREAVAKGVFRSAKHHFIESGYFEGRKPARVFVDEEWYGRVYPDVSESVEFGELGSCQEHFDRYGEREGRLPAED
ncbi:MAG TPA: hypothetical protein VKY22_18110 [Bradyrhizobium sp.]|nr:hypothetical protein [Bradyrhizobium sp.]